ncbi:MAG: phytoene desaturase family protein [Thermoplasmatota archaeon]
MNKRVAVIGAGLGGLSAASRLARRGYDVDVYEQNQGPGGKANNLILGGYRFDTGPSLLTLPGVLDQLFEELGEERGDHLEFVRLDPITRYHFPDGTVLDAFSDPERFASEVEEKLGDRVRDVLDHLNRSRRIYDLTSGMFMFKSLQEISTYFSTDALKTLSRIRRIDALRTMHDANRESFSDERTIQLFDRYATYNGSSPYQTPATFNLIHHVEYGLGGYAVKGGIFEITRSLTEISEKLGVRFHFGKEVERIELRGKEVHGLRIDGFIKRYDVVISNSDASNTYKSLLDKNHRSAGKKYSSLEPSSSGGVFYWGVSSENEEMLTNNIFFSSDYKQEFDDIWIGKRAPRDPTVYVNITSKVDPVDAPPGCENWFVLVNVPYDSGQNWDEEMKLLRGRVFRRIERAIGKDIEQAIDVERMLDPPGIERRWSGNKGSIYGISSNDRRSAFRRQGNRSRRIRGLYFCGGSAHPGGGIPLVILSGKITSDLVSRYDRNSNNIVK